VIGNVCLEHHKKNHTLLDSSSSLYLVFFTIWSLHRAYRFEESWRWLTHWFQRKYLILCLIIWCSCTTQGEVFYSYYYWLVLLLLVGVSIILDSFLISILVFFMVGNSKHWKALIKSVVLVLGGQDHYLHTFLICW
jgi:hypothetical protein